MEEECSIQLTTLKETSYFTKTPTLVVVNNSISHNTTTSSSSSSSNVIINNSGVSSETSSSCYCVCCGCYHNNNNNNNRIPLLTQAAATRPLYEVISIIAIVIPQQQNKNISTEETQNKDNSNYYSSSSLFGDIQEENLLTWQEVSKTLLLCGVKRHHCPEVVQKLWEYFLVLCYDSVFECGVRNNNNNNNNNNINSSRGRGRATRVNNIGTSVKCTNTPSEFATVVRYNTFQSIVRNTSFTNNNNNDEKENLFSVSVCIEELISAAASLQSRTRTSSSGNNNNCNIKNLDPITQVSSSSSSSSPGYILIITKHTFDRCISKLLSNELRGQLITVAPLSRWNISQSIVQHRKPLIVFCGGTSGCGKSTLSSLITNHLCIDTLLSTDTIRQVLRKTLRREDFPELFFSTYEAHKTGGSNNNNNNNNNNNKLEIDEEVNPDLVIMAYEKQCEVVLKVLDGMLEKFISRNQPVVVEGVHLLSSYMNRKYIEFQARGIVCTSFLVSIAKEKRHMERFFTRAKCMTLSPKGNRYVSNFRHIRLIQQYLLEQAHGKNVNIINNTNVDKSLINVHVRILESMEICIHQLWDGKGVSTINSNVVEVSNISTISTSSPLSVLSNEFGEQKHKNINIVSHNFADPNISGKRMLDLLRMWRNEKKKLRAGGISCFGETRSEYCLATSFFSQSTRSRSAESLTSFRLQSLSVFSSLGDTNNISPNVISNDFTTPTSVWNSNNTSSSNNNNNNNMNMNMNMFNENEKKKKITDENNISTPKLLTTPRKGNNFFFHQPSLIPLISSSQQKEKEEKEKKSSSLNNITTTGETSVVVTDTGAAIIGNRKISSFRSVSADAFTTEAAVEDLNRKMLWRKKHKRTIQGVLCDWRAVRDSHHHLLKKEEMKKGGLVEEDEWDNSSRYEFPSLLGS